MDRNGWTAFDAAEPEERFCLYGYLLIWHVCLGVVAVTWEKRHETSLYTHWRPMPRRGWIAARERKPTQADADSMNCVLARHDEEGLRVTGWHQFYDDHWTHWMPTPPPPEDGPLYRKRFLEA